MVVIGFATMIAIGALASSDASGQGSLEVLHVFPPPPGGGPTTSLVQATDGNLYGTTSGGGTRGFGTIFRMTNDGSVTFLHFLDLEERFPAALIQGSDGNFYGTTSEGGSADRGTVFRMTENGAVTRLHSFVGGHDGMYPESGLILSADGNFYGTTSAGGLGCGGSLGCGIAFKMTASGTVTVLHEFVGGPKDGAVPYSGLTQASDGNFYGTTWGGGTSDRGTIFRMTPTGQITVLSSFSNFFSRPRRLIQATDGNFYGTTQLGGTLDRGTIFRMTSGGIVTVLHSFSGSDGSYPQALLQANDGNLYGTTQRVDGLGCPPCGGTVFRVTPDGTVTVVHSFTGPDGSEILAPLVQGNTGNLLGTATVGGAFGYGTVFTVTLPDTFAVLHSFLSTNAEGNGPTAPPIQGIDGNFYGTTGSGGSSDRGTAFRMTAEGAATVLHQFPADASDGSTPDGRLIQALDGNFYGTTRTGGELEKGIIFKMTLDGTVTVLYPFRLGYEGGTPRGLIQAPNGDFYGTASDGYGNGTVFRVTPDGEFTLLHLLTGDAEGQEPTSVILAADGNFYGTTLYGGAAGAGTVFQLTPDGTFTTLYSFSGGTDGANPRAALVQAADGSLYGTTESDGTFNAGTIFKITTTGVLTLLHAFTGTDGRVPSGLIQGRDGNLYGTTQYGGTADSGTIFRASAAGTLTVLHEFTGDADGALPIGGLFQAADGTFYGTTYRAGRASQGWLGRGIVFRLRLP